MLPRPEQAAGDARWVLLVLVLAERAWAHWMELRAAMGEHRPGTARPRDWYHVLRRLRKAAKWADRLEATAKAACDRRTVLEAVAYAAWMRGNLALETRMWDAARTEFAASTAICEQLARAEALPERQAVFRDRVEEMVPKLRFALFNLKQAAPPQQQQPAAVSAELQAMLDVVTAEAVKAHAQGMGEVAWKGTKVPVRNARAKEMLAAAQEATLEVAAAATKPEATVESLVGMYDKAIAAFNDAIQLLRADLTVATRKKQPKKTDDPEAAEAVAAPTQNPEIMRDTAALVEYATWAKCNASVQRGLVLIRAAQSRLAEGALPDEPALQMATVPQHASRPEDIVRLYDAALQSMADASAIQQGTVDPEDAKNTAAREASLRALRCYYVALGLIRQGKLPEAGAILAQTLKRAADARAHHAECAAPVAKELTRLDVLERQVRSFSCIVQARAATAACPATAAHASEVPSVYEAPEAWPVGSHAADRPLVQLPPQPEVIPCRPILFDLAFNDLEYPNLDARKQPPKSGFWSFWR
jgi:signal recognition particle subunit SRP68